MVDVAALKQLDIGPAEWFDEIIWLETEQRINKSILK